MRCMRGSELLARRFDDAPSMTKVAAAIGVTREAVRQWSRGISTPRPEHREALSVLLGIPVDSWLTDEELENLRPA